MTMGEITLTPKDIGNISVSGDAISPDVLFDKDAEAIEGILLWQGNSQVKLGELFGVVVNGISGSPADVKIIISGDVSRVKGIGQSMTAGEIIVNGSVDMHCGADMRGGKITVDGNTKGCWPGKKRQGIKGRLYFGKRAKQNKA